MVQVLQSSEFGFCKRGNRTDRQTDTEREREREGERGRERERQRERESETERPRERETRRDRERERERVAFHDSRLSGISGHHARGSKEKVGPFCACGSSASGLLLCPQP